MLKQREEGVSLWEADTIALSYRTETNLHILNAQRRQRSDDAGASPVTLTAS